MRPQSALAPLSIALLACSLLIAPLGAQASPPPSHLEYVSVQSGVHANALPIDVVVWSQFVMLPVGTPWLRLNFHNAQLGRGSLLRITSVLDGQTMTMRREHLAQWGNTSCYFNGSSVLVELVAGPNTQGNLVDIQQVVAGDINPTVLLPDSICGSQDNRMPSTDARTGRLDPIGCTGWIINYPSGPDKVHLSAGHCFANGQVLQFDVPASSANCSLVFPPPAKQFMVDLSVSAYLDAGVANDYWAFRCFPNPTTGRTTFQEQGAAFTLATVMPPLATSLANIGFGLDGTNANNAAGGNASCQCSAASGTGTRNQVQQVHSGGLVVVTGFRLEYVIDTCGGTSGGPVVDNTTGAAVAIHTHGACTTASTANFGTSILHTGVQAAILAVASPVVTNDDCATAMPLAFGVNGPFNNVGSTNSVQAFACGTNVGRDMWFSFTTCAGDHTFTTCTPTRTIDTVLQVFGGTCAGLVPIACNDDTGGACGQGSTLTMNLAGGSYFVRVGGKNQAAGLFDLVLQRPEIYNAGPIISDPTAGAGGAPASVVQTSPPHGLTVLGYDAFPSASANWTLADDFVTNGTWCVSAIEVFAYQDTATAPSITGVFLEVYNGDPSTVGVPVAGSPGILNNLVTTPGYSVRTSMTGIYRVDDTLLTDTTRQVQSVVVGLPVPLTINSASVPGGRHYLRVQLSGSLAAGPFVVPITVKDAPWTGDGVQSSFFTWSPITSGGVGQGVPFKFYGSSTVPPGGVANLGGTCSSANLEVRGAPHIGGVLQFELVGGDPSAFPMVFIGLTDPNVALAPFCGCVQHASVDLMLVGSSHNWQMPMVPSGLGLQFYTQGLQLFGPTLACDIGIGVRFDLTNGYRVRLF